MRERTTWNRDQIAKQAAVGKKADPYLMNQDHVKQQPPADKYVTGDPSTFAEDVHPSKDTWEAEYSGGQVKRDEIGMPEMRKDTFNHPEKTAADKGLLIKKANLTIRVASMMLGKKATEQAIEDQAVSLMHLPDAELVETFNRLAGDDEEKEAEGQEQGQQQQKQAEQQMQSAYQAAEEQCKAALQAGDEQGVKQAIEQMVQAQMQQQAQQQQAPVAQQQAPVGQQQMAPAALQQMIQASVRRALQQQVGQGQPQQQVGQQQAPVSQQQQVGQGQPQQQVSQQAPMQQQAQPQQQMSQQQQVSDDMLLDDMLMDEAPGGLAEMDIEMDAPSMDVGDAGLGPEDEVLKTLFANDEGQAEEGQEQQAQQQQKQAGVRTASTRTVGTRPSGGVSRVGGGAPAGRGSDADKLSSLWASAPDVKDAFNM